MSSQELIAIRHQIDAIDNQIISLLELRLKLVEGLRPIKPTLTDPKREQEILSKIDSPLIQEVYLAIFNASKRALSAPSSM